ncbi:MAG: hypothetical protein ACRDJT_10675 [Actinomycetota bacterium]
MNARAIVSGPRVAIALLILTSASTLASILLGQRDSEWIAFVLVGLWIVALSLVGTLIAVRRPENPIGWLFLVSATFIALSSLAQAFAQRWGTSGPIGELAAWFTLWVAVPGFAIFVWVFMFFPTGRLQADRWVWVTRAAWAGTVLMILKLALRPGPIDSFPTTQNPFGIEPARSSLDVVGNVGEGLLVAAAFLATASLVVRALRAQGIERLQMKWFVLAVLFLPVAFFAGQLFQPLDPTEEDAVTFLLIMVALLAIPITMGIAILRYRLYDIDRFINRTLVYAALTALLTGAYLLAVLTLQSVLPLPDDSPAIVAVSTLAVVAVFGPLRAGIKGAVDRRFNRSRYDAERTIAAFNGRLRSEVELDSLAQDLVGVVEDTMQPAYVSLWLAHGGPSDDHAKDEFF